MSAAVRFVVPLKSRCSMKCEMPPGWPASRREPPLTQTPIEAERRCGMASEAKTRPFLSSFFWTSIGAEVTLPYAPREVQRPARHGPAPGPRAASSRQWYNFGMVSEGRTNPIGLELREIEALVRELGEPSYRGRQIF